MRKILVLPLAVLCFFGSCSTDDNARINVIYPLVPIEAAMVPDTFLLGNEYTIELSYRLPTKCHTFNDIIAEKDDSLIYIGVQSMFETENPNCGETNGEATETSFKFKPIKEFDHYIFKFWQAENEAGEAIYLTKKIPAKTDGMMFN